MKERKNWSEQEDAIIRKLVEQMGDKPKWTAIAQKVNQLPNSFETNDRTAKQCRQRWHNKLNPQINGQEWSQNQVNKLYNLHNTYGNKWSIIAGKMQGRTDNCIKNKFYSTLRKGMRKINKYIVNLKRRLTINKSICIKQFKPIVLSKLIAVADGNYQVKLEVKGGSRNKAENLSQEIKLALVQVSKNQDDYFGHVIDGKADDQYTLQEELIQNIQQFCRNCKRKKGKRRDDDQCHGQESEKEMVIQADQSQMQDQSIQIQIKKAPIIKEIKEKALKVNKKSSKQITSKSQTKIISQIPQKEFCLGNSIDRFIDQRQQENDFLLKSQCNQEQKSKKLQKNISINSNSKIISQTLTSGSPFPSQSSLSNFWKSKANIQSQNKKIILNQKFLNDKKQQIQRSFEKRRISNKPTEITEVVQNLQCDQIPQNLITNMRSQEKSINFFQNIPRVDFIKTDLQGNLGSFKADEIFHYGNIRNHGIFPQNTRQNKLISSNQNIFGLSDRSRELSFLNSSSPFHLQHDNIISNSSSYSSGSNKLNISIPMENSAKSKDSKAGLYSSNQKIQIKLTQSQNFELVDQYLRRRSQVPQIKRDNRL